MLINRKPDIQLEGEYRNCWLNRATDAIQTTVASYERELFAPVQCIEHPDQSDQFWITLERWTDYSNGSRDVQQIVLLVKSDGSIVESRRPPLQRIASAAAFPGDVAEMAELEPVDQLLPSVPVGSRVLFVSQGDLNGTGGEVLSCTGDSLLVRSDQLGEPVAVKLDQVVLEQATPKPKSQRGRRKAVV